MSKFTGMVQNEHMKTFRRLSTWILFGIAAAIILVAAGFIKYYESDDNNDWRASYETQLQQMESGELEGGASADPAEIQYRLDHDVAPVEISSITGFISNMLYYGGEFLIMFIVIIGGGLVSSEFNTGTIKLLLTKTPSRFSILLSKYISLLFTTILFFAFFLVLSFIVGGLFFGFDGLGAQNVIMDGDSLVEYSMLADIFKNYGWFLIQAVIFATIAFALSTLFRSTALAIGFSIFIYMFFPSISFILSRYEWSKYVLFNNVDLSMYDPGYTPPVEGMTIGFSIAVLAVYYVIITVLTWWSFMKRDVTA